MDKGRPQSRTKLTLSGSDVCETSKKTQGGETELDEKKPPDQTPPRDEKDGWQFRLERGLGGDLECRSDKLPGPIQKG